MSKSPKVKITEGSNDVNGVWIGRCQRQIGHLDKLIESYER
jgi:hypothetical protein